MQRFLVLLFAIFIFPISTLSAEVLQVNSSKRLLIGDNNRSYNVQISCLEVDSSKEDDALKWLRDKLPRRTKVNIKPRGFEEGVLFVTLIDIRSNEDIAKSMEEKGLGRIECT